MEKGLCLGAMGVAGLVLLLHVMDMATGSPFGGQATLHNLIFIVASGIVGYISYETWREMS